jgi:large subunit ribosomal protein L22e
VDIRREGGKVIVESTVPFSKRYFKYLLRKYLKKNELRDYLRVIANSKAGYELRYFKMAEEEEGESA